MGRMTRMALAALLVAAVLTTTGCELIVRRVERPITNDEVDLPLDGAKKLDARLRIGVGELEVKGGTAGAIDGEFRYTRDDWKPQTDYAVLGDTGRLEVLQGDADDLGFGAHRNEWEIALPEDVPLDLRVESGVGQSRLDLGDLDLRKLDVRLGTGEIDIDLTGIDHDVEADVEGGVGEITITVPEGVGVRIVGAKDGIGDFSAEGFRNDGDALVNDAHGTAKATIEIALRRGTGDVTIIQAD